MSDIETLFGMFLYYGTYLAALAITLALIGSFLWEAFLGLLGAIESLVAWLSKKIKRSD